MVIDKIISQYRRDFSADIKCEFCGSVQRLDSGYDDSYYHREVLPNIPCKSCEKSTISGGGAVNPAQTRYPDGMQV